MSKLSQTNVDSLIALIMQRRFTSNHNALLCQFNHRVCNLINTTDSTSGAGNAYPSRASDFIPGFQWGSYYSIFSFMCIFCRSLFFLLCIFFWPLCCLFFFDIRILITPLVSSKSSILFCQSRHRFVCTPIVTFLLTCDIFW